MSATCWWSSSCTQQVTHLFLSARLCLLNESTAVQMNNGIKTPASVSSRMSDLLDVSLVTRSTVALQVKPHNISRKHERDRQWITDQRWCCAARRRVRAALLCGNISDYTKGGTTLLVCDWTEPEPLATVQCHFLFLSCTTLCFVKCCCVLTLKATVHFSLSELIFLCLVHTETYRQISDELQVMIPFRVEILQFSHLVQIK